LNPDVPDVPFIPDVPLVPEEPLLPLVPDEPELPDVPLVPLEPLLPEVPDVPLVPAVPDVLPVIGFQNKANYTDGTVTVLRDLDVTGSIDITGQYLVNGVPVSGDRNGLITTGSVSSTQEITGSLILGDLIVSGNLVGNSINQGLIKIKTEAYESGSIQFENYITASAPISQSNFIFGSPAGAPSAIFTGSVISCNTCITT